MKPQRPRRRLVLALLCAALAIGVGALFEVTGLWGNLERTTADLRFDVRGTQPPSDDVVLVGIDPRTVGGEDWPISRAHYARTIEQLERAGASVIALDVQITEQSDDEEADNALYTAVQKSTRPVVMATTEVDTDGSTAIFGGGDALKESRAIPSSSLFLNDKDGVIRRYPTPFRKLQTLATKTVEAKLGRPLGFEPGGSEWIDFTGPTGSITALSMADVEKGQFNPTAVRGKAVVIGVAGTFATTIGDVHETSIGTLSGPEIEAAAIATALADFPLRDAPGWVVWVSLVVLGLLTPLVAWRFGPLLGIVAGLIGAAIFVVVAQVAFNAGTVVTVVAPLAAAATGIIATAAVIHGTRPAWLDGFLDRLSPSRGGNVRTHRLRALLLLVSALAAVGIPLILEASGALQRVELSTVDTRFSVRGNPHPPPDVVLVAFDDVTFDELDQQWPFDRKLHADAIDQLSKAGARAIAYDVQFTEPSESADSDNALFNSVKKAGDVVLSTTEVGADGSTRVLGGKEPLKESRAVPASTNYSADADGRLRRMNFEQNGLASFPLAAARVATGKRPVTPPGDSAWIDFSGPTHSVETLSFSKVVNGDFPASAVKGKIVVVGSTATSLQDFHRTATSGDQLTPGAEIQAMSIQTVLDGFPLGPAPWWLNALFVVLLGAFAPLVALRARMTFAVGGGLIVLAAFVVAAQVAFENGTIYVVVYPILAALGGLLATGAIHGVTVAFEREQARDAFARFVPEAVVDQVLADADGVRLGGVRGVATVMFSDLRGFTSFSESLEPERVIESLNRYLTLMSEAILDHGGTLVAYMGDGIMAVFGAPLKQEDHADRALEAAREMLSRMDEFNGFLRSEGLGDGFKMGIGLNSGPVMSGNVGSERRLEYTALGDTTNTAARLEGMTKGTPHQLFISDSTKEMLTRPVDDLVPVGEAEVRGRKAKVVLWSISDEPPTPDAMPSSERVEA